MRCLPSGTDRNFLSFPLPDGWDSCYLHRFRRHREALVPSFHCCASCQDYKFFSDIVLGPHTLSEPASLTLLSGPREPGPFWYNRLPLSDKFSLIISMNMPGSGCLPGFISIWQLLPNPWGPKYQLTLAGEIADVQRGVDFSSSWWV